MTAAKSDFKAYLEALEKALSRGDSTEHTHRPALKSLIESLEARLTATNEPKREACGAPDFIITRGPVPIGYFETKDIGDDLRKTEKSEQLKRYRESLDNLILTDYLEFRWYVGGEQRLTARLASESGGKLRAEKNGESELTELFGHFLKHHAPSIGSPKDLAGRMAALARLIRGLILNVFAKEEKNGSLHDQLAAFKKVLLHDLTQKQFADMYAQTICYGLFAARCNAPPGKSFTREAAAYEIPKTNPFLRRMFGHIAGPDLDERVSWAVDDLAELLKRADMAQILKDFGRRTRREDPVVHVYETFLAQYDAKMREARGVYYTPEPVVSYIVRSVDHILKTDFGLNDGLADYSKVTISRPGEKETRDVHRVLILDPAAGTGTFLHGVVDQIHETFVGNQGLWNSYIPEHLLPRLFGFELLMAPYAVAHMKLGLQLAESGYKFESDERLRVFLTNTLEEAFELRKAEGFTRWLADEAEAASEVKRDLPIMVILGNPPYSGISSNMSKKIAQMVDPYKLVDGEPLKERKHWLQDDYVKFIRFAQQRIETTGYGVLAFVTNHGYLDNPTFRGMRQSLMSTFDKIYLLDLHGNSKKLEKSPDGSTDKNVFDIQQGVAIGVFVRSIRGAASECRVHHADLWGPRETYERQGSDEVLVGGKYKWLGSNSVASTKWESLEPISPSYFFFAQAGDHRVEYENMERVTEVLPLHGLGFQTSRDHLVVGFTEVDLIATIESFADSASSDDDVRRKFFPAKDVANYLPGDTRQWLLSDARRFLQKSGEWRSRVRECLYRPFDFRQVLYDGHMVDWPRPRF